MPLAPTDVRSDGVEQSKLASSFAPKLMLSSLQRGMKLNPPETQQFTAVALFAVRRMIRTEATRV